MPSSRLHANTTPAPTRHSLEHLLRTIEDRSAFLRVAADALAESKWSRPNPQALNGFADLLADLQSIASRARAVATSKP